MALKWNENLIVDFLQAYKQYPCLWNPYDRDYYNCCEKNVALQKIIDDLNTPGFTAIDYLQQIKSIREKYKQEHTRTINSLQSQRLYKSPFPWYNIVADMFNKVVNDEEKIKEQNTYSILRSLSTDDIRNAKKSNTMENEMRLSKNCACNVTNPPVISRRSNSADKASHSGRKSILMERNAAKVKRDKKVRYTSCPRYKTRQYALRDNEEGINLTFKPTKDTEFETVECPAVIPSTSVTKNDKDYDTAFSKCPLCGWIDEKYENAEKNVKTNCISCFNYDKHVNNGIYTSCVGCNNVTRDDRSNQSEYFKQYVNHCGDFEVMQNLPKEATNQNGTRTLPEVIIDQSLDESTKTIRKYTITEVRKIEKSEDMVKNDSTVPLKAEILQSDPIIENKLKCGVISASTQLKIILSELKKNLKTTSTMSEIAQQNSQAVQSGELENLQKGIQVSPDNVCSNKVDSGINTVTNLEKGVQTATNVSDGTKKCNSIQTVADQRDLEKNKHCRNVLLESKAVMVNIINHASKGIQCTIHVMSVEKMVEVETTMSVPQIRSVGCMTKENIKKVKSKCTQSLLNEKFQYSSEDEKWNNSIENSARSILPDVNLNQTLEHESQDELSCTNDTCPSNVLGLIKENLTMAVIFQELLQNILHKYRKNVKSGDTKYQSKNNCSVDSIEMANAIQEYMTMTVKSTEDNTKDLRRILREKFSIGVNSNFIDADTSISCNDKLVATEENIFQPVFGYEEIRKTKKRRNMEDESVPIENYSKKVSAVKKKVLSYSDKKDVGSNGSPTICSIQNVQTQSNGLPMKDSVCLAKYEEEMPEKISIGTQKRDPILVRLIQCTGKQSVVKSDKETLTVKSDTVAHENIYTDKHAETCGRSNCFVPSISKKLSNTDVESTLRKEYKDKMACDFHRRSVTFKDDVCDENCKGKLSYDWTDVRNVNVFSNVDRSKIPWCIRPRKCTMARNK